MLAEQVELGAAIAVVRGQRQVMDVPLDHGCVRAAPTARQPLSPTVARAGTLGRLPWVTLQDDAGDRRFIGATGAVVHTLVADHDHRLCIRRNRDAEPRICRSAQV